MVHEPPCKKPAIVVAECGFHAETDCLNLVAPEKIEEKLVTLVTSQFETAWLNAAASANIELRFVAFAVFHLVELVVSGFKPKPVVSPLLKAVAPANIELKSVTFEVTQALMFWLNDVAPANVPLMLVTAEVVQPLMSWLNEVAPLSIFFSEVTPVGNAAGRLVSDVAPMKAPFITLIPMVPKVVTEVMY